MSGDRDPGLQPERTRLAWRRTTLSGTVAAVLGMKAALHGSASAPAIAACVACGGLWLGLVALAHRRIRVLASATAPTALSPRHASAAALCTVALAVCAAALVI
ncbi:uncharacterized membrane protein YidH (DUF202 family) [Streptomyces phaeoluteigriseus]